MAGIGGAPGGVTSANRNKVNYVPGKKGRKKMARPKKRKK